MAPSAVVRRLGVRRTSPWTPYAFLAPFGALFLAFIVLPAVYGIWISLHDYDYLLPHQPWVGLQNYTDLFKSGTRDSADFWNSMQATGIFTLFSVPFLVVLPMGVALLLTRLLPAPTLR